MAGARHAGAGEGPPRPLEGFCVALREPGALGVWPATCGSGAVEPVPRAATPPKDDAVMRAGAMPLGQTRRPGFDAALAFDAEMDGVAGPSVTGV